MSDGSGVETAIVGSEGIAPLAAFHGVYGPVEQIIAQVPGEAWRVTREAFDGAVRQLPSLSPVLHRYAQALFTMAAQSSGCNRKHSVVQRCARWLLLTHDRVPGDEFALTHLFLAQMLGVRRSSVTIAAEALRAAGAITYTRGRIKIVDRDILRSRCCECYDVIRTTYDRLIDGKDSPSPLAHVVTSERGQSLVHSGDTERRDSPAPRTGSGDASQSLDALRSRLRAAIERSHELQAQLAVENLSPQEMRRAAQLLTAALQELHVIEEELQSRVEATA